MNTGAISAKNQKLGHLGHFFINPNNGKNEFDFRKMENAENLNAVDILKGMAECGPACPNLPSVPDLAPLIRSLEVGNPNYCKPKNGALVLGLYRDAAQAVTPVMLSRDPETDLYWDVVRKRHVNPPSHYIHLWDHCRFDPQSGHPIINGAECPF